ncbi:MAG: glycosyltransferase family 2 protein [Gammaproteobacteria bacterium]
MSVVIRNFNRAATLPRAIDSVLAQNWQDFELLVVDDASTDNSVDLVRTNYGGDPRVELVELLRNGGAAAAANAGIHAARGRYVAFLDSDDSWLPEYLQTHVGALEANPRAVMTYSSFVQVWAHYHLERLVRAHASRDQRLDMLLGGFVYSQSMTVARRTALLEFGGFDPRYRISHDYELWLRLALELEQPFVYVDRPLVRYHMSADALTTDYEAWIAEYMEVMERGYAHQAAEPYRSHKDGAKRKIEAAVLARREVERWLARTHERPVSVILRTRNRRAALARAVASVEAQTYRNFEIVVVNDAAEDDTASWLATKTGEDFKAVNFDSRRGRAAALNYGTLVAEGELLAFLDDDDEWLPDYLAAQVRAQSFVIGAPAYSYTDYYLRTDPTRPPQRGRHVRPHTGTDLLHHQLFNVCPHSLSMLAVLRQHVRDVGGADETLDVGEDVDLYLRLLAAWCDPRVSSAVQHAPAWVQQPLVIWSRATDGCDRAAMKTQYLEQAERMYDGFFATPAGRQYRFLKPQLVNHMRREMSGVYANHFGV